MIGMNGDTLDIPIHSVRADAPTQVRALYPTARQHAELSAALDNAPVVLTTLDEAERLLSALQPLLQTEQVGSLLDRLTWLDICMLARDLLHLSTLNEIDKKKSAWQSSLPQGSSALDATAKISA